MGPHETIQTRLERPKITCLRGTWPQGANKGTGETQLCQFHRNRVFHAYDEWMTGSTGCIPPIPTVQAGVQGAWADNAVDGPV